jgi:hypothetical protein
MRGAMYSGDRRRVSFTHESELIIGRLVGSTSDKRFRRISDLVNFSILIAFGSTDQKAEDKQARVLRDLKGALEEFQGCVKKERGSDCLDAAQILAACYGLPIGPSLADRAGEDWGEHWREGEKLAVWQHDEAYAKFACQENVLSTILTAMTMMDLGNKITVLRDELRTLEALKVKVSAK